MTHTSPDGQRLMVCVACQRQRVAELQETIRQLRDLCERQRVELAGQRERCAELVRGLLNGVRDALGMTCQCEPNYGPCAYCQVDNMVAKAKEALGE